MTRAIILLAVALVAAPAAAQGPRAPYLQRVTPDEVTVVWRAAGDPPAGVCFGEAPDRLDTLAMGTATDAGGGVRHVEVTIEGLPAGTRRHYAVGHDACPPPSAGDPAHHFTTAPPAGDATPFRFWLVGDSGTGGSAQRRVFDSMRDWVGDEPPDLFVHVGDMAYSDGTTSEFDSNFYAVYAPLLSTTPVWPAIGNHEGHTSDSGSESGPYYDGYVLPRDGRAGGVPSGTEAYYAFDWSNVHFIVLDSYDSPRDESGPMVRWLEMDLAATTQPWIVAFWHHPPYTDGSHEDDESALEDMRRQVLPALEAGGVDLVLGGHSHIYERSYLLQGGYHAGLPGPGAVAAIVDPGDGRPDGDGAYRATEGALYVVAGHGGTGVSGAGEHPLMAFTELDHGSCLIDVAGDVLTLRNLRDDGVITDEVMLVRGDGLFVAAPSGDTHLAGSDVDVVWTSVGASSGEVRVEYSLDDGATWATVVERTEDDGHHVWSTPRYETTVGRVRVTDASDPDRQGTSPRPFALSAEADVRLVEPGSTWEYHDGPDAPPADWATTTGGWPSGPAQLGYGDGDEATVLRDEDPNIPSVYFRRALTIDGELSGLVATVTYDDAFALLVDGEVVGGVNVDDGLDHETFASASSDDDAVATVDIDASRLGPGEHVIGVIVKQSSGTSSDVSFDLSLSGRVRVDVDPLPDGGTPSLDAGATDGGSAGGDSGAGGSDAGGDGEGGGGDCGCRVGGRDAPLPAGLVFVALGAIALRRRAKARD